MPNTTTAGNDCDGSLTAYAFRLKLTWYAASINPTPLVASRAQSGCIETMCKVLDTNNRTNTWQRKDACVVEQCLSALALHVHRRPEVQHCANPHACHIKKHKTAVVVLWSNLPISNESRAPMSCLYEKGTQR